jgi:hypothetical protein
MASYNDMHGFYYELQATLPPTVYQCITDVAEFMDPLGRVKARLL